MKALETHGDFDHILLDPDRIIPAAHLRAVCKYGQGECTCRYIGLAEKGFVCVKNSRLQATMDAQVKNGNFTAKGINCEGLAREHGKKDYSKEKDHKEGNSSSPENPTSNPARDRD